MEARRLLFHRDATGDDTSPSKPSCRCRRIARPCILTPRSTACGDQRRSPRHMEDVDAYCAPRLERGPVRSLSADPVASAASPLRTMLIGLPPEKKSPAGPRPAGRSLLLAHTGSLTRPRKLQATAETPSDRGNSKRIRKSANVKSRPPSTDLEVGRRELGRRHADEVD